MRKKTGILKKITVFVFAAAMVLTMLPSLLPGSGTVYAAAVTKDKALSIALADAGFTRSSVTSLKAVRDRDDDDDDDGWEISFKKGGYRYEYDISRQGRIDQKEYKIIKVKK